MERRIKYKIEGVVQGVGFRPFIYRIAKRYGLTGFVYNHSDGVDIELQGNSDMIAEFEKALRSENPPLSSIDNITCKEMSVLEDDTVFSIIESRSKDKSSTLIPPDIATCDDCVRELFDPKDKRYMYPFINCMNCGPRYTIVQSIPYDRKNTTMDDFPLCDDCRKEYEDPAYRRFHAEPNACPICGPALELVDAKGRRIVCDNIIDETKKMIRAGKIIAIKGLGGFHLACDAFNEKAVKSLRERKKRYAKPFAVMSYSIDDADSYAYMNEKEIELLKSPQRPILLLRKKKNALAPSISFNNNYTGVMLAYNPIQLILLKDTFRALVMTSGNMSDEPICITNEEAIKRLNGIADAFLIHNRRINTRVDDSVAFVENNQLYFIRRARGYVPSSINYNTSLGSILALGGELKSTTAFSRGCQVITSQHIGDIKSLQSYNFFTETIQHMSNQLALTYDTVAYDLHPDYLSSEYAETLKSDGVKTVKIQHHKAHTASCIIDNNIEADKNVIGVALDGTGYGEDGTIWGGEFFFGNLYGFKRVGRLMPVRMPGGDKAVSEPYRMAVSYLFKYFGEVPKNTALYKRHAKEIPILLDIINKQINSPLTSSAGRLFDAVASLIGIRDVIHYEGQAAIDLQMVSENKFSQINLLKAYPVDILYNEGLFEIDSEKMFEEIIADMNKNITIDNIGIKFHKTISEMVLQVCEYLKEIYSVRNVMLSGGVFQNRILLKHLPVLLNENGFIPFTHKNIPCNDGGISVGQIALAYHQKK